MAQEHVGAFSVGDTITVYPVGEIELIEDVGESFKYRTLEGRDAEGFHFPKGSIGEMPKDWLISDEVGIVEKER